MSNKYKERGGGPATGLADDLISMLRTGISGSFGGGGATSQAANANPLSSTMGISGVLNDLLSGGAGNIGGSMSEMISKETDRNANALRSRFGASGGMSMGTPAAYGEALLRSESAPKLTQAIGGLQMQALLPLLQMMTGLAGKGISQREMTASPNPWASAAGSILPAAGTLLSGPLGGMMGGMFGGGGGGLTLPGISYGDSPFPGFDLSPWGM